MPLDLTELQATNTEADVTRPVFGLLINHSGSVEYLSLTLEFTFDGQTYSAGLARLLALTDSISAKLELAATPDRVNECLSGAWRDGDASIYYFPSLPGDSKVYSSGDEILLLDGKIRTSAYSGGKISVELIHHNNATKLAPRHTWDQFTSFTPAAGTLITWEGNDLVLTAPDSATQQSGISKPYNTTGGRLTASKLKELSSQPGSFTLNGTGQGAPLKLIYGTKAVAGDIIVIGAVSGDLLLAIGWGYGQISAVSKLFINDSEITSGGTPGTDITFTHYLGEFNQDVDSTLAANVTAFDDNMVLTLPAGSIAAAYTVIRIPSGELSTTPTVKAIIDGIGTEDPRIVGENDSEWANTVAAVNFDDGLVDSGPNALTVSLYGTADVGAGYAVFDGSGAVLIDDDAAMAIGASTEFEICIRFQADDYSTGTNQILAASACTGTADYGWDIVINTIGLIRLRCSDNGTPNNLFNTSIVDISATDGKEHVLVVRRYLDTGTYYFNATLNGVDYAITSSSSALYDASLGVSLGAYSDGTYTSSEFTGKIKYFRLTVGGYRAELVEGGAGMISGTPFPEYAQFTDNSALCTADIGRSPFYGAGRSIPWLSDAADHDDELISSNERARLSVAWSTPRKVSEYLDLGCSYAEAAWFNVGADIYIIPDRIIDETNPCGQDVAQNYNFDTDTIWTKGTGWSIASGTASCDGTQTADSDLSQTITTDVGGVFVITGTVATTTAGNWSVLIDSTSYDSGSAADTIAQLFTATATSHSLKFRGDSSFIGSVTQLRVRRLYWLETSYIRGSFSAQGLPDDETPTSVKARWTASSSSDPNWAESLTDPVQAPGVSSGDLPLLETTLNLPGVFREAEAVLKADAALQRYSNRVSANWQTTDHGVRFKLTDVIEVKEPTEGVSFLGSVRGTEMTSPGRWTVKTERYDESHYPTEIPATTGGTIPVGAIVLLSGTTVPSGWASYSTADGSYIIGAGNTYAVGDTGGSTTYAGFSGNTSSDDSHGTSKTLMKVQQAVSGTGSATVVTATSEDPSTTHNHSYSTGSFNPQPYRRENRLIQKTGSTATAWPPEAMVFGLAGIVTTNRSRITTWAGRVLRAKSTSANAGTSAKTVNVTTGSYDDGHDHWSTQLTSNREIGLATADTVYTKVSAGSSHTHDVTLSVTRNLKRTRLALYGGTGDYPLAAGDVFMWEGSLASLPTDCVLCDGTGGTPYTTDYFVEIAASGNEETSTGDNTVSISGTTDTKGHNHNGGTTIAGVTTTLVDHSNTVYHYHTISASDSWTPPYYALAFLMYSP